MKKRIISMVTVLSLIFCLLFTSIIDVKASTHTQEKIAGSYLTMEETSKGSTNSGISTRGIHLMDGECSITKAGVGRIYVYASTTGNHDVDYISTVIYVDQYNEKDDAWDQIDAWQVEDVNTYYVSTSKYMMVDRGYYYRVHADHVVKKGSDPYEEATTLTDGIFIN